MPSVSRNWLISVAFDGEDAVERVGGDGRCRLPGSGEVRPEPGFGMSQFGSPAQSAAKQ